MRPGADVTINARDAREFVAAPPPWLSDANIGFAWPRGSSLGGVIRTTVPLNGGEGGGRKADSSAKSVTANGRQIEIRADVAASAPDQREQRQCHDRTL